MNGKKRTKSAKSSRNMIGKDQKPLKRKFLKASAIKKKSPKLKKKETIKAKKVRSSSIKSTAKAKRATVGVRPLQKNKIVRIMGQGQFMVDNKILKKLNEIDNSIVQLVSNDRTDNTEFKKRLTELTDIVGKNSKQLDPKEIVQSDIILPSTDLSIEEAKRLFQGEGVVPEF
jgi:trehalose-6-phosphatase